MPTPCEVLCTQYAYLVASLLTVLQYRFAFLSPTRCIDGLMGAENYSSSRVKEARCRKTIDDKAIGEDVHLYVSWQEANSTCPAHRLHIVLSFSASRAGCYNKGLSEPERTMDGPSCHEDLVFFFVRTPCAPRCITGHRPGASPRHLFLDKQGNRSHAHTFCVQSGNKWASNKSN